MPDKKKAGQMSTVNANFSINNLPQVDRYHDETIKAPLVDQAQKEQINKNERVHDLHRTVESHETGKIVIDQKNQNQEKRKKNEKRSRRDVLKNSGKKRENRNGSGLFVDVEC
jgi:hypothetical protein